MFQKAIKYKKAPKIALIGPSGYGKTWGALVLASEFAKAQGREVALGDSENKSSSLYSRKFEFDMAELKTPFTVTSYRKLIDEAVKAQYGALVIDSFSHVWFGEGGLLDQHAAATKKLKGNSMAAWKDITPMYNELVQAVVQSEIPIIACMRAKTAYTIDDKGDGKTKVTKQGMGAVQRDGIEFEFDIVFELDDTHHITAVKDRSSMFPPDYRTMITPELGQRIWAWANDGTITLSQEQKKVIDEKIINQLQADLMKCKSEADAKQCKVRLNTWWDKVDKTKKQDTYDHAMSLIHAKQMELVSGYEASEDESESPSLAFDKPQPETQE